MLSIRQADSERIMRSFWMDRLRGHTDVAYRVPMTPLVSPSPIICKIPAVPVRAEGAIKRLCLGIGDGSVRRQ
jgi:hypothetical protein